jgi:hypothetical protein
VSELIHVRPCDSLPHQPRPASITTFLPRSLAFLEGGPSHLSHVLWLAIRGCHLWRCVHDFLEETAVLPTPDFDTSVHRFLRLELCAPGGLYDGSRSPALTSAGCPGLLRKAYPNPQIAVPAKLSPALPTCSQIGDPSRHLLDPCRFCGVKARQGMNCNLIYADKIANQQGTDTRLCRNMVIDSQCA